MSEEMNSGLAGEYRDRRVSGVRNVVVGVKMDGYSKELLTWALVKVAQPGDHVVALHVLSDHEVLDRDGKSSLLALVKAFDSILGVYEGFCNLKQVDFKLKICRGSSIRKILVREAKAYAASVVILGAARTQHTIRSQTSVAKYCARKLPKECSVIAVDNGKIVFHKETPSSSYICVKGSEDHHKLSLRSLILRSLGGSHKIRNECTVEKCDQRDCKELELALVKVDSISHKPDCSICSPDSVLDNNPCAQFVDNHAWDSCEEDNPLAIVPVQKPEAASNSTSLLIRGLPELKPGWPLLRKAILSNRLSSDRSPVRQIAVVQWAMRLPIRQCLPIAYTQKEESSEFEDGQTILSVLDQESSDTSSLSSTPSSLSRSLPAELEGLWEKYSATCRLFQYQELVAATSDFKPENMIGKGGNSQVYRGRLPDGKELAVKILKSSAEALEEFVLEIEIISALHHENIISLFGFCYEDDKLLLVYDFLSQGSLEDNLHGDKQDSSFGWSGRYKVAIGVAEALVYLHSTSPRHVIHRDVKSSNILLSDDFEPQLSDFGLAKWAPTTSSYITCSDVAGTFGYLAPEYFMYGKVNEKIDVYAFGVVLLELLSGRRPICSDYPKGEESLVIWAKPILSGGKFAQLLDQRLGDKYDGIQMERMALAASLCIRRGSRARPQMSTILKLLQGDEEVTKWAKLELDTSEGSQAKLQFDALEITDAMEDEGFSQSNIRSHLSLALLDVDDSSLSMSSVEDNVSLEEYLRGRWSNSSSFN